jgi:uncharacterized phage-like protein YoqJ
LAEQWRIACGTGHRTLAARDLQWLADELLRVLGKLQDEHGLTEVISGMALTYDQHLAEITKFGGLRLHAMPPFPSQYAAWPEAQQNHWREIMAVADEITVVSPTDPDFDNKRQVASMLHKRNDAMLDAADIVIAGADLTKLKWNRAGYVVGGTWSCVDKAVRRRMPIIWIDPKARTTKKPTLDGWHRIFREQKEKSSGH